MFAVKYVDRSKKYHVIYLWLKYLWLIFQICITIYLKGDWFSLDESSIVKGLLIEESYFAFEISLPLLGTFIVLLGVKTQLFPLDVAKTNTLGPWLVLFLESENLWRTQKIPQMWLIVNQWPHRGFRMKRFLWNVKKNAQMKFTLAKDHVY